MTRQQEGDETAEKESLAQELADAAMSIFMPEGDRRVKDEDPGYKHSFNQAKKRFGTILRNRSKLPTPEETTLPAMDEEINLKHEIQFPGMAGLPYRVVYNGNSLMSICSDADKVVVAKPPEIHEGRHTYFQAEEREGKSMQFMVYAANRHHALTESLKWKTEDFELRGHELDYQVHRAEKAEAERDALKDHLQSVLERESATTARYDARLDAVVGQETAEQAWKRARHSARSLSNILFNLFQGTHVLTENDRASMLNAVKKWDADHTYTPPLKAGTE